MLNDLRRAFFMPHIHISHAAVFRVFFSLRSEIYYCLATRNGSRFSVETLNSSNMKTNNSIAVLQPKSSNLAQIVSGTGNKIFQKINSILPDECKVQSRSDAWFVAATFSLLITIPIYYLLPITALCVYKGNQLSSHEEL